MKKQKIYRIVAAYMALVMIFDVINPSSLLALTSGPSQPEVQSFEPVNTTEMVDPFTGDFNYNIPLMTVPGPNGGYPINLAYHGGIGMEQEASWVGLGWNLNVGTLNRSMRGLPDDLNGEIVKNTVSTKPTINAGFGWDATSLSSATDIVETFGAIPEWLTTINTSSMGLGYQMYWNNYRGVGISLNMSTSKNISEQTSSKFASAGYGLNLSLDPQSGAGVQPSFSLGTQIAERNMAFKLSAAYSTRDGLYKLGLNASVPSAEGKKYSGGGSGMSFCGETYVPGIQTPTLGLAFSYYSKIGIGGGGIYNFYTTNVFGSWTDIKDKTLEMPGYGYLYSDERVAQISEDPMLMDVNRENEVPVTRDAPYLPVPSFTSDAFLATGQGMGMGFRPYRSDIGVLYEPRSSSDNVTVLLGQETSPLSHVGFNVQAGYSRSYSGKWNNDNDWDAIANNYQFQEMTTTNEGAYEPFYFKSPSDMTATDNETGRYSGTDAERFDIKMAWAPEGALLSFKPKVKNVRGSDGKPYLTSNLREERDGRSSTVEFRTLDQVMRSTVASHNNVVASVNTFPGKNAVASPVDYQACLNYGASASQIGEYTILGTDGMRYEYAIPAYNTKQEETMFSVDQDSLTFHVTSYDVSDASIANDQGRDHFFSSTELPAYAYSYLLTAVYSADYVDLKGDGPTDDDLGYFAKFNYNKTSSTYQWRTPFKDANYEPGFHSDALDDKATYAYGEKEIWYLNSVETKTHIAEFYTSKRNDGYGVSTKHNTGGLGEIQRKLDRIELYSKTDRNNPIKTVHFEYDYSLCKGVPNNINNTAQNPTAEGKLTLQKLWFEYKNNHKGKLVPYQFNYREGVTAYNPDYNILQMDRWGSYKADRAVSPGLNLNEDDPYVTQDNRALADQNAAAWSLYKITLPSGGKITIDYEADDYAYVQDKEATQMFQVLHTGSANNHTSGEYRLYDNSLTSPEIYNRVYFKLKTPTSSNAELQKYIAGVDQMYFKSYVKLKKYQDDQGFWQDGYDYVDGFCKISSINFDPDGPMSGSNYTQAYITLSLSTILQDSPEGGFTHPFSKAAWEYMKIKRSDLLFQSLPISEDATVLQNIGGQLASIGYSYFRNISQLVLGYYTQCYAFDYAKELNLNTYHPSFIRLKAADGIKVGGGHRVKRVSMSDNWYTLTDNDSPTATPEASYDEYGVEYDYRTRDGLSSSGVASYEPLIGGEENPMRLPSDRFSSGRRFVSNQRDFYLIEPIGESYYPAPVVGYSRVTIRNLKHVVSNTEVNKTTAPGITVLQFYTAKDFPVRIESTTIDDCHYAPGIVIPFVGSFGYDNHGYSQGYSAWLNDMHGKLKSVSTYAYQLDPPTNPAFDSQFETRTEYVYQTDSDDPTRLDNLVSVLDADGLYRSATIGQQTEFFTDMIQHSGFSLNIGAQINIEAIPPVLTPWPYPMIDYNEQMFRSVVGMKVTMQNGVLKEVITTRNGASAYAENLMFDAATGQPLLTSLTNEHENPVYSYSYAAHWDHDGLGPAYKNYNFRIITDVTTDAAGNYVVPSASPVGEYFVVGDKAEVAILGSGYLNCWIRSINTANNSIELIDENGAVLMNKYIEELRIVRSGRTNQTAIGMGHIVALDNPVTGRQFPLFEALNELIEDVTPNIASVTFNDCETGNPVTAQVTIGSNTITFALSGQECQGVITLPPDADPLFLPLNSGNNIYLYRFYKRGQYVSIERLPVAAGGSVTYYVGTWSDPNDCYKECLPDVLDAGATRFADTWDYNYIDIGNPVVERHGVSGTNTTDIATAAAANPYRFGKKGIWRAASNYLYQVDRKQSIPEDGSPVAINTKRDGVYENFAFYNWRAAQVNNPRWTLVNTMTMYSPYGFDLENRDALGHHSSAMYGYGNSVATSVTSNSTYFESAFDGFEDYANNTYPASGAAHGHITLTGINTNLTNADAHTGLRSVNLTTQNPTASYNNIVVVPVSVTQDFNPATAQTAFSFVESKRYSVCAWFKKDANAPANSVPQITVTGGSVVSTHVLPQKIEGWQRVEVIFDAPATTGTVSMSFGFSNGGYGLLDDIRVQPFTSAMKTFVYEPVTLWLVAELDNRNFATYYNYDEEGSLVQVKKETEKGIVTVKTSRNNTAQNVAE